ncbi:MAG: NGG1p interacting factor NIF3 [Methylomonas sp.]
MYKLIFYVPASHLESVKNALFDKGAGRFRNYDRCCWQVLGKGQFRPLEDSQPFLGETGRLEIADEYKVEMICADHLIKAALQTLLNAHPYEEPAYEVYKILTEELL